MQPSVALAAPDQPVPVGTFLAPLRMGWVAILVGATAAGRGAVLLSTANLLRTGGCASEASDSPILRPTDPGERR